ncbi:MAG: hypothetical protein KDC67_15790, partial [Ignavibacteriae bacterium]|nr:hypothetical protein [Ignavibacteriota bacterium]
VDDLFATQPDLDIEDILEKLELWVDQNKFARIQEFNQFESINFDQPKPIIKKNIQDSLEKLSDLKGISEFIKGKIADSQDLPAENLKSLCDVFNGFGKLAMESFDISLNDFTNESKKLFILDIEDKISKDNAAGIKFLKEILQSAHLNWTAILFSHSIDEDNEETKRKAIYQDFKNEKLIDFKLSNFAVMSKARLISVDNETLLKSIIQEKLTSVFSRTTMLKMAEQLKEEIYKKSEEVLETLAQENIYACEQAVFESTFKEGSSEIALLHRLFNLSHSDAVEEVLRKSGNNIVSDLSILRRIGSKQIAISDKKDFSYFNKLKEKEYKISRELINKTHSPLIGGDCFKIKNTEYILLTQACDTWVRSNGKRKNAVGYLIPFKLKNGNKDISINPKYKENHFLVLERLASDFSYWVFRFNDFKAVNLNVLDLAVFEQDGKIECDFNEKCPDMIFLEGWKKRFQILKSKLEKSSNKEIPIELRHLFIDFNLGTGRIVTNEIQKNDGIKVFLPSAKRTDRFRSRFADYILSRFLRYKMRFALDHDFTKS